MPRIGNMQVLRSVGLLITVLVLTACGSTGSQTIYSPASSSNQDSAAMQEAAIQQQAEAEEQARAQEQARLAEERRLAEARAAEERAEQERLAREREEQEVARREAERQRQLAERRAAEQARIVEAQKTRIEELQAKIAANESETENLEAANAVLRQAVSAAEELTDALMAEEEKYNNTDPATGQPLEELATARLEALADEVDSLNRQAESLLGTP
jgi:predicted small lipoprotein YifL